ncbi:MAG TPA: metal-sensitive transcriptional regulator [bacterium]|nr:metal-sensitive transcriptional regulator [bacterium]
MKHQPIYNRLRRIEGQIRGIEEMLDKDRADEDVLIQLEAARSSLSSTVSSFLDSMFRRNDAGEAVLTDREVRAILRAIRKN